MHISKRSIVYVCIGIVAVLTIRFLMQSFDVSVNSVKSGILDNLLHPHHDDAWNGVRQKIEEHSCSSNCTAVFVYIPPLDKSLDVPINNIRILMHSLKGLHVEDTFFVFGVVGGVDNSLSQFVSPLQQNYALVDLGPEFNSDMSFYLYGSTQLDKYTNLYDTMFFINQQTARGPLKYSNSWISEYRRHLENPKIGIVPTTVHCQPSFYIDSFAFAIRSTLMTSISHKLYDKIVKDKKKHKKDKKNKEKEEKVIPTLTEDAFTKEIIKAKYFIKAYNENDVMLRQSYFHGKCNTPRGHNNHKHKQYCVYVDNNDNSIFIRYDSSYHVNDNEIICDRTVDAMNELLLKFHNEMIASNNNNNNDNSNSNNGNSISNSNNNAMTLIIPETYQIRSYFYETHRQYNLEIWRDHTFMTTQYNRRNPALSNVMVYNTSMGASDVNNVAIASSSSSLSGASSANIKADKVCFLVRTASIHDSEMLDKTYVITGVEGIVKSLMRQINPNWKAYFVITDRNPFEERLMTILSRFNDKRLIYIPLEEKYRPVFDRIDSGYTTTDHAIKLLFNQPNNDCEWLSITNADNVYGSEVVHNILTKQGGGGSSTSTTSATAATTTTAVTTTATTATTTSNHINSYNDNEMIKKLLSHVEVTRQYDMIFTPLDSRNFAEQDYQYRQEKSEWLTKKTHEKNNKGASLLSSVTTSTSSSNEWNRRCVGILNMVQYEHLNYCRQSYPIMGYVDLAAMFLRVSKWKQENILFSNFTNPDKYWCHGCQDGYLAEYLVKSRIWNYYRLPIDGLKSLVFHGPSPTWCIASGNIWFDHPDVAQVACIHKEHINTLRDKDNNHNNNKRQYDWHGYDVTGRKCLKFTEHAYFNATMK